MDWFIMVLLIRQHRVQNGTEGHGHPKLHYMATPLIKGDHCCSSNLSFMFSVHIFIVIYFAHSAFPYCHGKFNMTFTNCAWLMPVVPLLLCAVFLTFIYITLSVLAHTAQVLRRWSSHRDKRWQRSSGVGFWMTELKFPHYHFDWSECEWVSVWGDRHPHVTVLLTRAEKTAATYSSLYKHTTSRKATRSTFPPNVQLIPPHALKKHVPPAHGCVL